MHGSGSKTETRAGRIDTMTKEKFLTLRCNNILTLGIGLIMLIYVAVVFSTSVMSDLVAFIGLALIGAVY